MKCEINTLMTIEYSDTTAIAVVRVGAYFMSSCICVFSEPAQSGTGELCPGSYGSWIPIVNNTIS